MINKINSAKLNPLFLKNTGFKSAKQVYFKGNNLDKDIFVKSENINESKNSTGFDFAVSIIEKLKNQEQFDVNNEIKKFLKENNINNVDIKPIEEYKDAPPRIMGAFVHRYNNEMNENGGTLYLKKMPENGDFKEMQSYIASISHELEHVVQHQKNDLREIFIDSLDNGQQSELVFEYTQYLKGVFVQTLHRTPLQYCVKNAKELGIDAFTLLQLNDDIYNYATIFPDSSVKINENTVKKSFSGEADFSEYIKKYFNMVTENFSGPGIEEYATNETYDLIRKKAIHELRTEAQAYQINSDINKYIKGIDLNKKTLNDLIPMTYNLIADELEKIEIMPKEG